MRRHTMKQPSGPATSATPMPPTRARVKKSSSIAGLPVRVVMVVVMVGHYATVIQVSVVVVVAVDRQRGCRLAAEEGRSEEHTSELQSLMRISYAVFCLKKQTTLTTRLAV